MDAQLKKKNEEKKAGVISKEVLAEIEAKAQEFEDLCRRRQVPMTLAYFGGCHHNKPEYNQHIVSPTECGLDLEPDYITPTVAMFLNGFKIVPAIRANDNVYDASELAGLFDEP